MRNASSCSRRSALATLAAEERAARQRQLIETRRQEARAALATLGIERSVTLDAEDGQLATCEWAAQRLRSVLLEARPASTGT